MGYIYLGILLSNLCIYIFIHHFSYFNITEKMCSSNSNLVPVSLLWVPPINHIHFPFYPSIIFLHWDYLSPQVIFSSHFRKPPSALKLSLSNTYYVFLLYRHVFQNIFNLLCPFFNFCLHLRITSLFQSHLFTKPAFTISD